ncbi:MAG: anaerobic ribonucleoside-triphosphate reductase activating protein [Nanoarchaeota archaeon]
MIAGLQKTTLIDYPGKLASAIFTSGCNFRCGYCHNKDLVEGNTPTILMAEILSFLDSRKNILEGVCITGGEPTIHKELPSLCKSIKELGLSVKLDTNGTNPVMLKKLIDERLVDYIAMDIKASFENYEKVSYVPVKVEALKESVGIIKKSGIEHEFRTTLIPDVIDEDEIEAIAEIVGDSPYFLQQFRAAPTAMDPKYRHMEALSSARVEELKAVAGSELRGS